MFKRLILAASLAVTPVAFASAMDTTAMSGDAPMIHDAYARAATPNARSGAAFMVIMNPTDADDRLIEVRSDIAMRVELHTHTENADGVMQMREVEGGFLIPAGGQHALKRGGDHVMFMGLKESFDQGKEIPVTLVFEKAGEIEAVIAVDLERKDAGMHDGHGDHSNHGANSN